MSSSSRSEERRHARSDQAVAEEAPASSTEDVRRCCDKPVVVTSDGVSADEVGFCEEHRPANL